MAEIKKTIVVCSKNPVKLTAAREGFMRLLPDSYDIKGVSVPSEVADQPFSDQETLLGASNRVKNARQAEPDADFWIGIEGGVDNHEGGILNFAWVVVADREGRIGKARSSAYYLPEESVVLLREGMELGKADEKVFGKIDSRSNSGSVGMLTGDVLVRSGFYIDAVVLALIPFKNKHLTFK